MSAGCDCDDEATLAYLAGVITVAVILPAAFVLAVRHIEPVRKAFRSFVVERVDIVVGTQRLRLQPVVRGLVDGSLLTIAAATERRSIEQVVNEMASQPAADAVLDELGAPTGP